MDMAKLTLTEWQSALLVFLAVCAGIVLIGNTVKMIRDLRKPKTDETGMVIDHEKRIVHLEEINKQRDKESAIMLRSQMAVLSNILNGDSLADVADSQREIKEYLIKR